MQMLNQIKNVVANVFQNNAIVNVQGSQIIEIALDLLRTKTNVIKNTLDASNCYKKCKQQYKDLSDVRGIMHWYEYTVDSLRDPDVDGIRVTLQAGHEKPRMESIILEY